MALSMAALPPLSLPARADLAAVTSQTAETITLIDTERMSVLAQIAVPGKPAAVAVDPDRGRIAAVAVESGMVHVLDPDGRPLVAARVGAHPFGIAFAPDGLLLVGDSGQGGQMHEVDPASLTILRSHPAGAWPAGLDQVGPWRAIAIRDEDRLLIQGPDGTRSVAVGHHPFGVTLHQGRAFVTNVLDHDVSVVDLESARQIARIPTGKRPYAVTFAEGRGFVSNQDDASVSVFDDTMQRIDARTLQIIDEIQLPPGPRAFGRFVGLDQPGAAPRGRP